VRRLDPQDIDARYITAYLDNPLQSKTDTLREAGHPNPTRHLSWQIHDRLSAEIDKRLDKLIVQDAALGRSVLIELAKDSSSDSVRAASAARLMEYAGKQKPDRVVVESRAPEDIGAEIAVLQKRILRAKGEDVSEDELH